MIFYIQFLLKLWKIFLYISHLTFLDDLHCLSGIEKSIDMTSSWFLEIFVMFPEILCLLEPMRTELIIVSNMIHSLIISKQSDHLVIDFPTIIELHNSNNSDLSETSWNKCLSNSNNFYIKRITIFIPSTWDSPISKRISKRRESDAIELELTRLSNYLIFINRH